MTPKTVVLCGLIGYLLVVASVAFLERKSIEKKTEASMESNVSNG